MSGKNDIDVIRVSFKKTDFEQKLFKDIKEESKIMGDSAWMKIASYEKLERDKYNKDNPNSSFNMPSTRYESFDQLMP